MHTARGLPELRPEGEPPELNLNCGSHRAIDVETNELHRRALGTRSEEGQQPEQGAGAAPSVSCGEAEALGSPLS